MTQNALAHRPQNGTTLAARIAPDEWTRDYLDVLKATYAKGTTDAEFALAVQASKATGLRIDTRELWVYKRSANEPVTITISIDGFRAIAHASGQYAGEEGPLYCGKDGVYVETWLDDKPPVAAKFVVWRKDFERPFTAVLLLSEFRNNSPFWRDRPVHQSGIRAATHAFRKAYRQEIAARQLDAERVGVHLAAEPEHVGPALLAADAQDEPELNDSTYTSDATDATDVDLRVADEAPPAPAPPADERSPLEQLEPIDHYRALCRQVAEAGYDPERDGALVDFTDDAPPELIRPEYQRLQKWARSHPAKSAASPKK